MKIDITSMFFNSSIVGKTATAAWGTSIGKQNPPCTLYESEDVVNILSGMLYCSKTDYENLSIEEMSKNRELVLFSVFDKVYVNGKQIEGSFILLLVREHSSSHEGRMLISYPKYAKYKLNDEETIHNEVTMDKIAESMGASSIDTWFVYDISVANQDTLLINACTAGTEKYKQFVGTSKERSQEWGTIAEQSGNLSNSIIQQSMSVPLKEKNIIAAIKTKPFLILGGFSGTGKSQKVKELAFMTCPNDELMRAKLGNTDNTPGNYCLVSVRPNWHDSSDLLGYYSSINDKYIVTDFVRFLVKAMQYRDTPFFVCLDEMNLAPVEEYFAEFLSVMESRKKVGDKILTDPLLTADWFNKKYKEYNIFDDLGLKRIGKEQSVGENKQSEIFGVVDEMPFDRMDIVEDLKKNGLRLPQNIIVIGTVNMDDTTNSFSRKVIDRAMTFETIVEKFGPEYYTAADTMTYRGKVRGNWTWILPDEVKANEALMHEPDLLKDEEKTGITNFINEVNGCLKGSPFQIAYRILNETILYYRALWVVNHGEVELGQVFDDILMQKVLPRIEGDFDKTYKPLSELKTLAERLGWKRSQEKIDFMLGRFNKDDQGGFTSFWN